MLRYLLSGHVFVSAILNRNPPTPYSRSFKTIVRVGEGVYHLPMNDGQWGCNPPISYTPALQGGREGGGGCSNDPPLESVKPGTQELNNH